MMLLANVRAGAVSFPQTILLCNSVKADIAEGDISGGEGDDN